MQRLDVSYAMGRDVRLEQLPELIVPFKKRVYRAVVDAFRELV